MRVLIVDDDPERGASLAESLRQERFEVLVATTGLQALLEVKRARPDVVVLDLMMPHLGGLDALKRIRAFDPAIWLLVVTTVDDPELRRRALALGACAVFTKPVAASALVAAMSGARHEHAEPPTEVVADTPPRPSARVLIVDDDAEVRKMLDDLLTSMGYETRMAGDGAAAVRAVLARVPDVVLLDFRMAGLSGLGALPTILSLAPDTKVIMISGEGNLPVLQRTLAFGAHDYLTKPFDVADLSSSIETAIAIRRLNL